MRLRKFIREQKLVRQRYFSDYDINETLEVIHKNCKPFLKEIGTFRNLKNPLYRGVKAFIDKYEIRIGTRAIDREPKFTTKVIFEILDKAFAEKFGWWVRSKGVFTGSYQVAGGFGEPYIFFPVGQYKYVWSDSYGRQWTWLKSSAVFDVLSPLEKGVYLKDLERKSEEIVSLYEDKNLKRAMNGTRSFECIFNCKKYIVIEERLAKEVYKRL